MTSSTPSLRIVLDTNLAVSAQIVRTGPPAQVLNAWLAGRCSLATSQDIMDELEDVCTRPAMQQRYRLRQADLDELLATMELGRVVPLPLDDLPVHCRDPKDDKFLACALAAVVDYLVTGDKDLLDLDGAPALGTLRIVTPEQFLTILSS